MSLVRPLLLPALVAGVLFWIAYDGGSYSLESRATLAIALWWTIIIAVVLGLWPLARPPQASRLAGGFLIVFGLWTGISIAWAASAELAFEEFDRTMLFVAVFLVAVLAGSRRNAGQWANGIAAGIAAVGVLALASRLFLDVLPQGQVPDFLPSAATRLSWPVEYWNGLGILVGLSLPLLLRIAVGERALFGALALGVWPALAATMYLTSSRGGFAAAAVGLVVFCVVTPNRWPAALALLLALAGSAIAIEALLDRKGLVNTPYDSPNAVGQGRGAALLIVLSCIAVGLTWALASRLRGRVRIPLGVSRAAAALAIVALLAGIVAAHPVRRFDDFKQPAAALSGNDFATSHLLSGNGSGRWQFWAAALDEWETRPVIGRGAGSYESWWAQHGSFSYFLRDAHSLYLETLAELGIVGFLLLAGALLTGVVTGTRRLRASDGDERLLIAALLASYVAYLLAAGIDWVWELTVVSAIGVALLGLLTGPATAAASRPKLMPEGGKSSTRRRFAVGVAALVCGWLLICAQAIPFLADLKISASQAAIRRGDMEDAYGQAIGARQLQPWAASPYLQIALVQEQGGNFPAAIDAIEAAIERDSLDWRLWLVRARVETKSGNIAAARRSLARATELNPRSPLFANGA
jgi:O-Antigen ligase